MSQTQAFTVGWDVDIQPEGDVSNDVSEIILTRQKGTDAAMVRLDTSKRPHALEEQSDIQITISDKNDTITFDGFVDDVQDAEDRPMVTVDARAKDGKLDDISLIGSVNRNDLWGVLNWIVDTGPAAPDGFYFDASKHRRKYQTFAGSTIFGNFEIAHWPQFGVNQDTYTKQETVSGSDKPAMLDISFYENTTGTTYLLDITGRDANGDTVQATVDLPPGIGTEDTFGTATPKLAPSGGNGRFAQIDSISTNVPDLTPGGGIHVGMNATIQNFVKTDYSFPAGSGDTIRNGIELISDYISALDTARTWEYKIKSDGEVIARPEQDNTPSTFVVREGDNVIRPIAKRNLDGVKNFVKVTGAGDVAAWAWAYNGFFRYATINPFENGLFPTSGNPYRESGGVNDVEQIGVRAGGSGSSQIADDLQAVEACKRLLEESYRTSVSGTAPISGVKNVTPGDKVDVYYPSRGIPQKVTDNVFTVEKVQYKVTPDDARTEIDFGTKRPNAESVIKRIVDQRLVSVFSSSSSNMVFSSYTDATSTEQMIQNLLQEQAGGGGSVVVGTIAEVNADGTVTVNGEDGETYENVRVI